MSCRSLSAQALESPSIFPLHIVASHPFRSWTFLVHPFWALEAHVRSHAQGQRLGSSGFWRRCEVKSRGDLPTDGEVLEGLRGW